MGSAAGRSPRRLRDQRRHGTRASREEGAAADRGSHREPLPQEPAPRPPSADVRLRQALGEQAELPENSYPGEYLVDLVKEWIAADPAALRALAALPEGERVPRVGRMAVERLVRGQREVLEAYGTTFDRWVHEERDVRQAGLPERAIEALTAAGHTYEQDGALWFRSTAFGDDKDRVLRKSDGELTYFAVDIGFHHFGKFGGGKLGGVDLVNGFPRPHHLRPGPPQPG